MKKILVFIKNNNNEFLLLRGSDNDPQFHESFWYTVTGGVETCDKTLIDTVKREVKEETSLDVENIVYLNWILKYQSLGELCEEYVFVADGIDTIDIILNEENVEYKWLNLEYYVNEIKWHGDKEILKNVLRFALEGKIYLSDETETLM